MSNQGYIEGMMRAGVYSVVSVFVAVATIVSCGESSSDGEGEAGSAEGGSGSFLCTKDADCDDGLFCNGSEICSPAVETANEFGCLAPERPECASDLVCDESLDACVAQCDEEPDADGDGSIAIACGGDDCDDSNFRRFPGNSEVCDEEDLDEDCDPNTFGFRDQDMDGWPDAQCCNGDICGEDCDDSVAAIHPTQNELCDGLDNDCNGEVDDNVSYGELPVWYRDVDGDGYGALTSSTAECTDTLEGYSRVAGDCDDLSELSHPEAMEVCDGLDNDCDPGTHACWFRTRVGTPVKQPLVGNEVGDPFEISCFGHGEGVAEWHFYTSSPGTDFITKVGLTCGNYGIHPTHGSGSSHSPLADGVFTPSAVRNAGGFVRTLTVDDCEAISGSKLTHTRFRFSALFDDYDDPGNWQLYRDNFACSRTEIYRDDMEMFVGNPSWDDSTAGLEIGCPDGHSPIGLHGTRDTAAGMVTSLGMICAPLIPLEHL